MARVTAGRLRRCLEWRLAWTLPIETVCLPPGPEGRNYKKFEKLKKFVANFLRLV